MAKVNKLLSTKVNKATGKSEIMFRFIASRLLVVRAKSGLFIKPSHWKHSDGDIKISTLKTPEQKELIELKNKLTELCNVIIEECTKTDLSSITKEWLDDIIYKFHNPPKVAPTKTTTLLKYVENFIENAPNRTDKKTGRKLAYNNLQQYRATQKHLLALARTIKKKDFEFSEIDKSFYNNFVAYLQAQQFTQNGVGKHIRILKLMLNEAPKELVLEADYRGWHVFTEEVDTIYLNEEELQILKDLDLSEQEQLDRVRDWFLLLAWTGCRFSDLEKIGKTDIRDGFITFRQQKTNNKVTIPLHPVVIEILEKYGYAPPEPITNQKFNECIKEVVRLAGITQMESTTSTIGGKLTTRQFEKYELVSSHTGRRSFATNMYKRGLPSLMIMSITGHKTEKSFLRYIRVKQEEHATMMRDAWQALYG